MLKLSFASPSSLVRSEAGEANDDRMAESMMIGQQTATIAQLRANPRTERAAAQPVALSNVHPFRRLKAGAVLFHEGDERSWIYEVASGMLKLSRLTRNGRIIVIDFLAAGDAANLSDDGCCHYTAEAVGETWVKAFPRSALMPAGGRNDDLTRTILHHALCREAASQRRLMLLCLRHPQQRVAAFLLDMAQRQGTRKADVSIHIGLPMVRRDLADYLALAPETLSRVMRRLREDQLIEVHDCHDIELRDLNGLASLSN